jgi:hypothetical protein
MKTAQLILSLATLRLASGALIPNDVSLSNSALAIRAEQDEHCNTLDSVINKIGTSTSKVIYSTAGGVIALRVCQILHDHHVGPIGPSDCRNIAEIVGAAVLIIFQATGSRDGSEAAPSGDTKRAIGDGTTPSMAQQLIDAFAIDKGPVYNSISAVPVPARSADTKERQLIDRVSIQGFQFGSKTVDALMSDFGNGEGHVFVSLSASTDNNGTLTKRHNGPGFKLSYTQRQKSLLSQQHQVDMSNAIANNWAGLADGYGIGEWIGFEETDHTSNFYLRIIAETQGFGSNYESVDAKCGQMGQYL